MKEKFTSPQRGSSSAFEPKRAQHRLVIEHLPLTSLQLDPLNPRLHSPKQVRQIAESIKTFGFNVPIVIDHERKVIAGHGRFLASELLKISEVPTISLDHLSPQQLRAFSIADNRLAQNARWDNALLGQQLKALSEAGLDFSVEITGFELAEIDIITEGLAPAGDAVKDSADIVPAKSKVSVTVRGDLWHLGEHRVLCGDSLARESYTRLMNNQLADAVFADVPCNIPWARRAVGSGKKPNSNSTIASVDIGASEYIDFLTQVFRLQSDHSRAGSLHYIFTDWRHIQGLLAASTPVFAEPMNLCVWSKTGTGMGAFYRSQHELIFLFQNGNDRNLNNVRRRTDVWNYPEADTYERSLLDLRQTVKPVSLIADAIMDCTARGDAILDPFLDTGTTIVAAERTGRVCYGIELDPTCVDTIISRWQFFTGLSATHAISGRLFNELEEATHGLK